MSVTKWAGYDMEQVQPEWRLADAKTYVKWGDYAAICAERDALKAEVERLRVRNTLLQDEVREWRVAAKEITEFYSERAALERGEEAKP